MRRAVRGTDWGVLLAVLFSLLMGWSFVLQSEIPRTNDYERYLYRVADTALAMREGRLYPRWSESALRGFGAPVPNFYPPLPVYLAASIDTLFTNNPVSALNILCFATFPLAGASVYVLVARRKGGAAGLVAAVLYTSSPSIGIIAPHIIGDVPRVLLHALVPGFLWAVEGMLINQRPQDTAALILFTAGILLTDPIWLPLAFLLAIPLFLKSLLNARHTHSVSTRQFVRSVLACLCGIGLSAFFWLPAWAEQAAIRWEASPIQPMGMLTLPQLFTPFYPLDPDAIHPLFSYSLGLPLIAVLVVTLPMLFRRGHLFERLYFLLGSFLAAVLLLIFPERTEWLGIVTLSMALAASGLIGWQQVVPPVGRRILLPLGLAAMVIGAYGVWLTPHWRTSTLDFTPASQIRFEQSGYGVAVVPASDPVPLPITLTSTVPVGAFRDSSASPIEIISGSGSAQVGTLSMQSHHFSFQVRALAAVSLRLLVAWFPGWQITNATIPATLNATTDGLMEITIPENQGGEFSVDLNTTPIRQASWWIAGLSAVISVITVFMLRHHPLDESELFPLITREEATLTGIAVTTFVIVLGLFAAPFSPFPIGSRAGIDLDTSFPLHTRTDGGIEALAYQVDRAQFQPGETAPITLYWRTLRFLDQNYYARITLIDPATGTPVSATPFRLLGNYPTRRWLTGQHVRDTYSVPIPAGFSQGTYQVAVEIRTCTAESGCSSESALSFFNPNGVSLGRTLVLPVELTIYR
ncbi:MAG: 6-pyruvoyl-tetrahydropterin synthase-related protein [Anaerolineae bacterium]